MRRPLITSVLFVACLACATLMFGCGSPDADEPSTESDADEEASAPDISTVEQAVCPARSDYDNTLLLHAGYYGSWAACMDYCPEGSFVRYYSLIVEPNQGGGDDTGLNGVRLDCYDRAGNYTKTIKSTVGPWGNSFVYAGTSYISGFMNGARLAVDDKQGSGDDRSATDMQAYFFNILEIHKLILAPGPSLPSQYYRPTKLCNDASFVCGIRTRVEGKQGGGDDTSLNGVELACCHI